MSFKVRLTRGARDDLLRLEDFLIELALQRGDLTLPERALDAILREFRILETNPYTCRRASDRPFERELVIPFGGAGYVALFKIIGEQEVAISAIRHQREDDYH